MATGPQNTNSPTGVLYVPLGTNVSVGCTVTGSGIQSGTEVTNLTEHNDGYLVITLNQLPWTSSVAPEGVTVEGFNSTSQLTGLTLGYTSNFTFACITGQHNEIFGKTLSFKEDVRGWVSFKSFFPENAISMANNYYTFLNGKLYKHHVETVNRNTFYKEEKTIEDPFTPSSFNVILNDVPGSIKSFNTLNYEGSQTKVGIDHIDDQYFNLTPKLGWYVDSIETDQEKGDLNEFIEKEGKWFNYLKGQSVLTDVNNSVIINEDGSSSFDQSSFAIQGIGVYNSFGCTDPLASNYNPNANTDDGSCTYIGCTDPLASNYNPLATIDDGSCNYDTISCDTCQNGGWVSNIFNGSTCPTGWIPTSHVDPCRAGTIICDGCQNGAPVSQIFDGSICPEGWTPTGEGNPCKSWDCFENEVGKPSTCMEVFTGNGLYSSLANCQAGCNPASWKCIGPSNEGTCIEVFDGTGGFLTKAECQANCSGRGGVEPVRGNGSTGTSNWDCIEGACVDVGIGNGSYNSLPECQVSCSGGVTACLGCGQVGANLILPGCCDPSAANYNTEATCNDGSCTFIYGCTDPTALNYNAAATVDDGSCCYVYGCTHDNPGPYPDINGNGTNGNPCPYPCIDPAFPPGTGAMTIMWGYGFTNFNPLADCDDGSCNPGSGVYGCTDPTAVNYFAGANWDDGSCTYGG